MKKVISTIELIISILTLFIFTGSIYATQSIEQVQNISHSRLKNSPQQIPSRDSDDYFEDFESGASGWSFLDDTAGEPFWHTDTYNAYGGAGKSWWMGNPEVGINGGYLNDWYQVLDTPEIQLPGSGEMILSFQQFRGIEPPGIYNSFDGWDGFNVRIRKVGENYREATVLTNPTPVYNCSSLYSFGFIHGECPTGIPGIPGWGGSAEWYYSQFIIPDSFQGEDVIISFSFASDGAECTVGDDSNPAHPSWTGIFVDDINVADVYFNNGDDATGFNAFTPTGGQLWHIYEADNLPSPYHAMGCFNEETGSYNPFMEDYLISPEIEILPDAEVWWDMSLQSDLDDPAGFPDCDFIRVEIRFKDEGDWSEWNYISNPTGGSGTNYVFTGDALDWQPFSQSFPGYNDISILAGNTVQFRIGLHTNADSTSTFGLRIDNFEVQVQPYLNPARHLNAEYDQINSKTFLQWKMPFLGIPEELVYCVVDSANSFVNDAQPYAIKVTNDSSYAVPLKSVNFMLYSSASPAIITGTVDVTIWDDANGLPGNVLYSVNGVQDIPHYSYMNVDVLGGEIVIPSGESVFVGISNFNTSNQGILADNEADQGHSFCFAAGQWMSIFDAYTDLKNICITATVLVNDPSGATDPIGYNVYRSQADEESYEIITSVTDTIFIDENLELGYPYFYSISALYENGESDFSNIEWIFAEIPTAREYIYDNGTAYSSFSSGNPLNCLAVKISPQNDPVRLIRLKCFLKTNESQLVFQVWDDNGINNFPGDELLEEPIMIESYNLRANAWNVITLPVSDNIILEQEEDFYVGWVEVLGNSKIGMDSGNPVANRSYQYIDGEWFGPSQGVQQNIMMRAIVDTMPRIEADFECDQIWGTAPFETSFFDRSRLVNSPIVSWDWNFGDGYSANVQNPNHIYEQPGTYSVSLQIVTENDSIGLIIKENFIHAYSSVWAGDTNCDGIVDTLDVIPIGIYFRETGPARDNISFSWTGNDYPGIWSDQEAAFADCNGDGEVNLADVLAIGLNWQNTHSGYNCEWTLPNNFDQFENNFMEIYNSLGNGETDVRIKNYIARLFDFPQIPSQSQNILANSYPNPFNPAFTDLKINFSVKDNSIPASVNIYNIKGQIVKKYSIKNPELNANSVSWNGKDRNNISVSSGIYFYTLETNGKIVSTKKIILMK
ncbi:MAG: PKD domain-containing protein [Candidatus Cloacimonadota bacterium]|nr:PKD domain-containing protein [Candidatus Cloacimonadota bacterium]